VESEQPILVSKCVSQLIPVLPIRYDRSRAKHAAAQRGDMTRNKSNSLPIDKGGRSTCPIEPGAKPDRLEFEPSGQSLESNARNNGVTEGTEMLYTRMADAETTSYRRMIRDSGRVVYLGQPFNLTFVVQNVCQQLRSSTCEAPAKMHYEVPEIIGEKALNLPYSVQSEMEETESLKRKGALIVPERSVSDKLIHVFFQFIHPACPVFDRKEFARLYKQNKMSLLVLQVVYCLAVTVCDESLVQEAGFDDRSKARIEFYTRAKALYHADYERDKVKLVSVLFLMAFWSGGPLDEKDAWHWLGASIGLAQTMGMHRS